MAATTSLAKNLDKLDASLMESENSKQLYVYICILFQIYESLIFMILVCIYNIHNLTGSRLIHYKLKKS